MRLKKEKEKMIQSSLKRRQLNSEVNEEAEITIARLKAELTASKAKNLRFEAEFSTLKERIAKAEASLSNERRRRREMARSAAENSSESQLSVLTFARENDSLKRENALLTETNDRLIRENNQKKELCKTQKAMIEKLRSENSKLLENVSIARKQNEDDMQRIAELESQANELSQTLSHNKNLHESKVALMEAEREEESAKYEENEKTLSQRNSILQKRVVFAEDKVKEYENQIQNMSIIEERQQVKVEKFEKSLQEFREQKEEFETMLNETQNELETEKITKNSLMTRCELSSKELSKTKEQLEDATQMLNKVSEKCKEQATQIRNLTEQNSRYKLIFETIPMRIQTVTRNVQSQFDAIINKISAFEEVLVDAKEENDQLATKNEQLADQVNETMRALTKFSKDRNKMDDEIENAVQTICCLTGTDVPQGNAKSKLKCIVSTAEKMVDEVMQSRVTVSQCGAFSECKENFQAERTKLYEGISELRSALKLTKKNLIKSEAENAELRKEIAKSCIN